MITSNYFNAAILFMACITFAVRYSFFTHSFTINLHPKIQRLLRFTAPCILTAMFIPIVFQHGINPNQHGFAIVGLINSSYFWAGLLAVVLSLTIRHTLLVIIVSMIGFYSLRYIGLN